MFFLDVKANFLKKCKKAGLLDHLFEEILDTLHFIQKRLMDETASESGTEMANFLCRFLRSLHENENKTKSRRPLLGFAFGLEGTIFRARDQMGHLNAKQVLFGRRGLYGSLGSNGGQSM